MSDDLIQFPYVLIATPSTCVQDQGSTFTLQECYSRLGIAAPQGGSGAAEATINILFCAGEVPGTYQVSLDYVLPNGVSHHLPPAPITFEQPYAQQRISLGVSVLPLSGWHFYDVRLNGRLVVRVPLEVEIREKMPPLGRMVPYPERVSRN